MNILKPELNYRTQVNEKGTQVLTHACGSTEELMALLSWGTAAVLRKLNVPLMVYLECLMEACQMKPVATEVKTDIAVLKEISPFTKEK